MRSSISLKAVIGLAILSFALLGNTREQALQKLAKRKPLVELDSSRSFTAVASCIQAAELRGPYKRQIEPTPDVIQIFLMIGHDIMASYTITPRNGGSHLVFRRLVVIVPGKDIAETCAQ